jgi:hypothetical protein
MAVLRQTGESQSTSPLKRRHKVVINGLSRLNNNLEDQQSLGSPLLKVFHSTTSAAVMASTSGQDDTESVNSNYRNGGSSRKVIKATITIPMPKADLGGIRFKSTRGRKLDDSYDNISSGEQSPSEDEGEDERIDSPDHSLVIKENSSCTMQESVNSPALLN